jgi:hypothetical protein
MHGRRGAGCNATERWAGGGPSGGGRETREKKQRTEKKEPDVFKYLIFGG